MVPNETVASSPQQTTSRHTRFQFRHKSASITTAAKTIRTVNLISIPIVRAAAMPKAVSSCPFRDVCSLNRR